MYEQVRLCSYLLSERAADALGRPGWHGIAANHVIPFLASSACPAALVEKGTKLFQFKYLKKP